MWNLFGLNRTCSSEITNKVVVKFDPITQFDVAIKTCKYRNGMPIFSNVWPNSLIFDTWIHLDMTFHVELV